MMKPLATRIIAGLSIVLVTVLLVSTISRVVHNARLRRAAEEKLKLQISDAKGLVKTWADRLDGQTSNAGVYQRVNDQPESNLSENDPWGNPLKVVYSKGGVMEVLKVICLGPDGKQGTKDDIEEKRQATNFSGIKDSLTPGFLKKKNVVEEKK